MWACLSLQLMPVQKDGGIFIQLFHRPGYRWHCSWFVPPLISHLPIFLLLYFPSHPIPGIEPMRRKVAGNMSFSAISCSFFKLLFQVTWKFVFSVLSIFMVIFFFFFCQVMTQSGLAMALIFHTAFPSTSLVYSSKLLLSSKRYFSTSCWMEAMVGVEVSTANRTECGKDNVAPLIVSVKKFYSNAVTPIHLCIIYGCSHAIRAHLSNC